MTIDEAIALVKIERECIIRADVCDRKCEKCDLVQDSGKLIDMYEQLAEWLEDYKRIKMLIPIEQALKNEYNKAIDDFVENISLEISESIIWGMLVNSHKDNSFNDTSDKIVDYVINTANEIAEQLKVGVENGKKKYIELS